MAKYDVKTANTLNELYGLIKQQWTVISVKDEAYTQLHDKIKGIAKRNNTNKNVSIASKASSVGGTLLLFNPVTFEIGAILLFLGLGSGIGNSFSKTKFKNYRKIKINEDNREILLIHKRYKEKKDTYIYEDSTEVALSENDDVVDNNIISKSAKFTFDNFVVVLSNTPAYYAAKAFSMGAIGAWNSKISEIEFDAPILLIYGGKGVGKTHLLNAIRNDLQEINSKLKIAFVDKNNSISEISDDIDVLLIDDVQLFMNDEFFYIYNSFVKNNTCIALTADKLYSQFIDEHIELVEIEPADIETKLEIKTQKLQKKLNRDRPNNEKN